MVDFLQSVADDQGKLTGVTSLIGSMAIKPAHTTSDNEVGFHIGVPSSQHRLQIAQLQLATARKWFLLLLMPSRCKLSTLNCSLQLHSALQTNTVTAFNVVRGATKAMMANKLSGSIVLASASSEYAGNSLAHAKFEPCIFAY